MIFARELFWVMLAIVSVGLLVLVLTNATILPTLPVVILRPPSNITYFFHAIEITVPGVDAAFGKMRCVQPSSLTVGVCLSPAFLLEVKN